MTGIPKCFESVRGGDKAETKVRGSGRTSDERGPRGGLFIFEEILISHDCYNSPLSLSSSFDFNFGVSSFFYRSISTPLASTAFHPVLYYTVIG